MFKVFDYWTTLHSESAAAFLRSLGRNFARTRLG